MRSPRDADRAWLYDPNADPDEWRVIAIDKIVRDDPDGLGRDRIMLAVSEGGIGRGTITVDRHGLAVLAALVASLVDDGAPVGSIRCRARGPGPPSDAPWCRLREGHLGPHVGVDTDDDVIVVWRALCGVLCVLDVEDTCTLVDGHTGPHQAWNGVGHSVRWGHPEGHRS